MNMADFATRLCMRPGPVDAADHAAIVRERMEAAQRNAKDMSVFPVDYDCRAYAEGRYHALRDCLDEMMERGKP